MNDTADVGPFVGTEDSAQIGSPARPAWTAPQVVRIGLTRTLQGSGPLNDGSSPTTNS
jgi:hypothetical protein